VGRRLANAVPPPVRRAGRLALSAIALAAVVGTCTPTAHASCVNPRLSIDGQRISPGDQVTVRGTAWTGDCNDVVVCGCLGCQGDEPARPDTNITISLASQDHPSRTWVLAEGVDANDDLSVFVQVTIPVVPSGRYGLYGQGDAASGASNVIRVTS
jgi:hypothetical protein